MNTAVPVVRCMLHGSGAVLPCKSDHQGMSSRANVPLRTGGWRLANHARASKQPARALTTVRCTRDLAPAGPLPRAIPARPASPPPLRVVRQAGGSPAAMCRRAPPSNSRIGVCRARIGTKQGLGRVCACSPPASRATYPRGLALGNDDSDPLVLCTVRHVEAVSRTLHP